MGSLLVNIDVSDLARGIDFYSRAFGLRVGRRFGTTGAELLGFPAPLYLLEEETGSRPSPGSADRRRYERHWTPVHLDVVVDAIEPAIERARAAGAVFESEVSVAAWGKMIQAADPFGNGFCLVQFLGRGYDEIANCPP